MSQLARWFATAGGLGYSPVVPGTVGSLLGLLLGVLTASQPFWVRAGLLLVAGALAVIASTNTERTSGVHDPSFVVIDEVWGMWAVVAAVPTIVHTPIVHTPAMWVLAFGLFRLFDIIKPPPLKWFAKAPAGWGIMLDDVGASAYTILLLQLILALNH